MTLEQIRMRARRAICRTLVRRNFRFSLAEPIVSFSFDDFPVSAATLGSQILEAHGFRGTYYASFGLAGTVAPTGRIFGQNDVQPLVSRGHEIGCHTYSHSHAWETSAAVFQKSVEDNQESAQSILGDYQLQTLAYPISCPSPGVKQVTAARFACCRGGGQNYNVGLLDRNYVAAFFLEKSRDNLDAVRRLVEQSTREKGWLIFATHDVDESPTPFGVRPDFFASVVRCVAEIGVRTLPVASAWNVVRASGR